MKNIFRKISIALAALMLVSTVFVLSDSTIAMAAETNYTVTFHYTRADGNVTGYDIDVWGSGNDGKTQAFTSNGTEGTCVFNLKVDTDIYDEASFIFDVHVAGTKTADFDDTPFVLTSTSQDVYIAVNGENKAWGFEPIDLATLVDAGTDTPSETSAAAEQPTTPAATTPAATTPAATQPAEQPTTAAQVSTDTQTTGTTPATTGQSSVVKENNKDYSVGFFQALLMDIVLFGILGGLTFLSLSKEKIAALEKRKNI